MKAKSWCPEKLQDLFKFSEQFAAVNKTTQSSNKIDFEKVNKASKGYDRKKAAFSDREDNFIRKKDF